MMLLHFRGMPFDVEMKAPMWSDVPKDVNLTKFRAWSLVEELQTLDRLKHPQVHTVGLGWEKHTPPRTRKH